tara:strand:+ start:644 stop:916 length:273 start_codon:yes stop_codon:yes gene_type:complete
MSIWQIKAIAELNPEASYETELDKDGEIIKVNWRVGSTPTDLSIINSKAEEIKTADETAKQEKADLKASAKAKLIAGEPLTEEEANTIVL